jgi:hypothetical protein
MDPLKTAEGTGGAPTCSFWSLCKSDKTDVFTTRTKNKVEKRISFIIGHETTFSASALEHCVQITLRQTQPVVHPPALMIKRLFLAPEQNTVKKKILIFIEQIGFFSRIFAIIVLQCLN